MEPQQNQQPPVIFGALFFLLVLTTVFYQFKSSSDTTIINSPEEIKNEIPIIVTAEEIEIVKKPKIFIPRYPHCKRNDSGELYDMVVDLMEDVTKCNSSEKLSIDCEGETEARGGTIVVYTAVVCLMVSLGAAAVELYRHRSRINHSTSPKTTPHPPQLSRRCSLADLTVLRHNRRESMLRRDSSMHMSFEGSSLPSNTVHGQHLQRVPLKLLGSSKSQDDSSRRGPTIPGKICKWQRSISADKADEGIPDVPHHRIHMIRHH